ncbi:MAG: M17 family metallopeptidase [Dermatophilaceae bacterium]
MTAPGAFVVCGGYGASVLQPLRPPLPDIVCAAADAAAATLPSAGPGAGTAGGEITAYICLVQQTRRHPWGEAAQGRARALSLPVAALAEAFEAPTALGATVVPLADGPVRLVVFAGCGEGSAREVRLAAAAAVRAVPKATTVLLDTPADVAADALVEGAVLGSARPLSWTADGPYAERTLRRIILLGDRSPGDVALGRAGCAATLLARALAATPSNVKNPAWLADAAAEVAQDSGLAITVWDENQLAAEGFGGILAVGQGSATPPRLVRLDHVPDGADDAPPIVLVGKGITFDTGGLDIKPAAGMLGMKTDMSGAAIVLAVLAGCRALGVPHRVIGLLPLAENAVGSTAYRPGDVITQFGGRTVEVVNTDAEGRLVLADALAYAVTHLAPRALVDIATLTGHAKIALSEVLAASYATDEVLHNAVRLELAEAGEPVWPMPLIEDYRNQLDSPIADLTNVGPLGKPNAGSILAALFLREFVGDVPWVHLDIAGPGRSDTDTGIVNIGATGYGARGLLRWLTKE